MSLALLRKWMLPAFVLCALLLFYFANRAAYKSYFSDDDLTNIGWPTFVGSDVFYDGLLTPKFTASNFRPVGFLYYRIMGRTFKLNYPPYILSIQALHVLNVVILFFLLLRLDFSSLAAVAGALFYAFHAAVMEAYWQPMYVFDLLCATFCLITFLLYIRGHWILALPAFWLAYKSKEIAVMLPAALLAYEWLLGRRNWKRLIPYFVISLSFGLQALWHNAHVTAKDVYALNFSAQTLWSSIVFYSSAIFFVPFAGLAMIALPIFLRDRRLYFGLIAAAALLLPMIALSNRVASVYWYVPLIGLAVAAAAVASRAPRWAVALFFVLWWPLNYVILRGTRSEILSHALESRSYVSGLQSYAARVPPLKAVIFGSTPPLMKPWGIEGALKLVFGFGTNVVWSHDRRVAEVMPVVPSAIVSYYPLQRIVKGMLRTRNELQSQVDFKDLSPPSQFGEGWYRPADVTSDMRWISPKAEITLYRPAASREFQITGFLPEQIQHGGGPSQVTLLEDGRTIGVQTLSTLDGQTLRWQLPAASPGNKRITILSEPVRLIPTDLHEYGVAIRSLGYVE